MTLEEQIEEKQKKIAAIQYCSRLLLEADKESDKQNRESLFYLMSVRRLLQYGDVLIGEQQELIAQFQQE